MRSLQFSTLYRFKTLLRSRIAQTRFTRLLLIASKDEYIEYQPGGVELRQSRPWRSTRRDRRRLFSAHKSVNERRSIVRTVISILHHSLPFASILTGVELVQTVQRGQGSRAQSPRGEGADDGELALVQVVGEDAVEADVRVNDERECQCAVEDRRGAVLGESNGDDRDEGGGKGTLEGPVVGAVRSVGLGEGGRVVDGALDIGCERGGKRGLVG